MRTAAVLNLKGGVGKTVTVVNVADILAGCVVDYQARKPKHEGTYLVYNENEEMWHEAYFHECVGENGEFGWWQAQYGGGGYIGEEFQKWDGIVCWLDCALPQPPKEGEP